MKWRARLNLPREHGAWAMFYVPLLLGILVGGGFSWPVGWLIIAASALFISRESLLLVWRSRLRGRLDRAALFTLAIDGLFAIGAGAVLLFHYQYLNLLWLGLPGLFLLLLNGWQSSRRADRTMATEILAIGGMTLAAPAAHYVASGRWDGLTGALWGFSFLYFASSVFYVKYRVAIVHRRDPGWRRQITRLSLLYHLLLPAILALLVIRGAWSILLIPAFLPIIARALYHHRHPPPGLNLKQIGVSEIVYALVFLTLTTFALA